MMRRQSLRTVLPAALALLALVPLSACGRSQQSSDNVVPVATTVPATTDVATTEPTGSTVPESTTPVDITVDPAMDQALAELEQLMNELESDLRAGEQAAANGG